MTHSTPKGKRPQDRSIRLSLWALAGLIVLPTGCALNQMGADEVSAAIDRFEQQRAQVAARYDRLPTKASTPSPDPDAAQPETPETLRDFIVLALANNPTIRRAQETAHARAARIPQVTALPDPMVRTKTLPEPVRTAEGDNFFILGVSQKFPVPAKLDRAGRIALEETRMALEQLQQTRLAVIADVKRTYSTLYAVSRSTEITMENRDLLRSLIDVARSGLAAGRRPQEDVLRSQVELSSLEAQLVELRQRRATAVAMLNRLMDRPTNLPIASPAEFDARTVDAKLEELLERAGESNPELQRVKRQIERDQQAVELAKLSYWPDFTVGFEWMLMESREAFRPPPNPATGMRPTVPKLSEEASDNWAITVGFNIPIWRGKIEARIREARRKLNASQQQYNAVRNAVYFRVTDALERVRSQQELSSIFRHTIIPQAQQTFEVSRAGYVAGGSDFLNVIDNWQKWLKFRIQYHRILGELEKSVADLEQVLGMSITQVGAAQ